MTKYAHNFCGRCCTHPRAPTTPPALTQHNAQSMNAYHYLQFMEDTHDLAKVLHAALISSPPPYGGCSMESPPDWSSSSTVWTCCVSPVRDNTVSYGSIIKLVCWHC